MPMSFFTIALPFFAGSPTNASVMAGSPAAVPSTEEDLTKSDSDSSVDPDELYKTVDSYWRVDAAKERKYQKVMAAARARKALEEKENEMNSRDGPVEGTAKATDEKKPKKKVVIVRRVVKKKVTPETAASTPAEKTPSRDDRRNMDSEGFCTPENRNRLNRHGSTLSLASTIEMGQADLDEQLRRCSSGDQAAYAYMMDAAANGSPTTKECNRVRSKSQFRHVNAGSNRSNH